MRFTSAVRYLFFTLFLLASSAVSFAQIGIGISVGFAPPALPVYEQPICPTDGYLWTPGFWSYDSDDYYWVPGTWVEPPQVGFLWTPAYWGWGGGGFLFHEGYWGEHVGWYGGVSYGFGYFGNGYEGGRWENNHFSYNRTVNNVNVNIIHNTYNTTIINRNESRVSYNGGTGGLTVHASVQEESYANERHVAPVAAQNEQVSAARGNPQARASVNQGKPAIAATQRAGVTSGAGVVAAKEAGGRYEAPANRPAATTNNSNAARPEENANRPPVAAAAATRAPATHAKEITPYEKPAAPNTGNPKTDQKYQQQQQKLYNTQTKQVQQLQQKQEQDHQRLTQQKASQAKTQQVEQQHQQQTQQLQQRHTQQQQQMQQKQQPAPKQQPQHESGGKPNKP